MDDETLLRLDRATVVNRQSRDIGSVGGDLEMFEQLPERQLQRSVDDQTQRAAVVVLAEISHCLKSSIRQHRHGDQKLIGQVGGLGHDHSIGIRSHLDKPPASARPNPAAGVETPGTFDPQQVNLSAQFGWKGG